ncbi:hypothetical protein LNQ81_03900 [Myroides sp. M-43]|uniref:hypothetical protein n=1 Tax=Myroides oncorhynchi TaxID=2893756 RepID=UPI001E408D68|nr:hypothetical protein [Myroides oncorhynchi]MCC9041843.1 hypothetical protein [Myroides oncorhynchi]
MNVKHLLFCISFFLFYHIGNAQENNTAIHGRIITREGSKEDILITNTTKGNSVISDKTGYFDIASELRDTLKFTSPFYIEYTYVVNELDLKRNPVLFPLEQLYTMNQLNEIVITKYDGGSLGLFDGMGKKYTPAERKLRFAKSGIVEPLYNWLSGRTSILKKSLEYEREGFRVDKFLDVISNVRLINYFKIPADYTESFVYYAITKEEVKELLNSNLVDSKALERVITPIVFEYLDMLDNKSK